MKPIVLAALAASLLAGTAMAQDRGGRGDRGDPALQTDRDFRRNSGDDRAQQQYPLQQQAAPQPPAQQPQTGPQPGYGSYLRSPDRSGQPPRPGGNDNERGRGVQNTPPDRGESRDRGRSNNERGGNRVQDGRDFDSRGDQDDRRFYSRGFDSRSLAVQPFRDRDRGRPAFNSQRYRPSYRAPQRYPVAPYRAPSGFYFRSWSFGDRLPFGWYTPTYYLDWGPYGLPYPPVGCEWVRVGNDALLVDIWTGAVLSIEYGLFW